MNRDDEHPDPIATYDTRTMVAVDRKLFANMMAAMKQANAMMDDLIETQDLLVQKIMELRGNVE